MNLLAKVLFRYGSPLLALVALQPAIFATVDDAQSFALQAAAFIRAVRERKPAAIRSPYGDALNSLAAVLGANASAARGGTLLDVQRFPASD